jgi:hypothetical protein
MIRCAKKEFSSEFFSEFDRMVNVEASAALSMSVDLLGKDPVRGWVNLLPRGQERLTGLPRQPNGNEVGFRVEVAFPGFVDNAKVAILRGLLIRQNPIDFPEFQVLTAFVLKAQNELRLIRFRHSVSPEFS